MQDFTTIEYILPTSAEQKANSKPIFILMVDTAVSADEMAELKDSLQQSINFIPEDALVGLITYGKMVFVHELGFTEMPKAYAFRGTKAVTAQQVSQQLGIAVRNDPRGNAASGGSRRFLLPIGECEFAISSILDDLMKDAWPTSSDKRPQRCTGVALSVAVGLLEATCAQSAAECPPSSSVRQCRSSEWCGKPAIGMRPALVSLAVRTMSSARARAGASSKYAS